MENTTDYRDLKPHPLAKLFPKYGEEELLDLASDIAANGQMQQCRHTRRAGATPMATSNRLAKLAKSSEILLPDSWAIWEVSGNPETQDRLL
jgi:hypothetical protein